MSNSPQNTPENPLKELERSVSACLTRARRESKKRVRRRPELAIEISPESLRAVTRVLSTQGEQLGPLRQIAVPAAIRDDQDERVKFLGSQLRRLLRDQRRRDYVCVLPPGSVRSMIVSLPILELADEAGAIAVKLMKLISGQADQWAIDVTPLHDDSRQTDTAEQITVRTERRFLLSAVPRTHLDELIGVVAEAGSMPSAITNAAVLFPRLERPHPEDTVSGDESDATAAWVVVQVRSSKTGIHIYRNGELEYSREIEWGGNDVTSALTDVVATPDGFIELSFEEAEQLKQKIGIPAADGEDPVAEGVSLNASQVRMMLTPKLNTFVFELRNSIRYFQQASGCRRLARLTLTGGGSRLPGLDEFVHQQLKLRPHRFGPDETSSSCESLSPDERDTVFTQAPHLVAGLQGGAFATDLTPPQVRLQRFMKRPFRVGMTIGAAALVAGIALSYQLATSVGEAKAQAGDRPDVSEYAENRARLEEQLAGVDLQLADLERLVGFGVPIAEILAELGRCTPPEAQLLRVSLEDQQRGSILKIRGVVTTAVDSTEQPSVSLMRAFRGSPYFAELEIESLQKQSEGERFEFTLAVVPYSIDRSERP